MRFALATSLIMAIGYAEAASVIDSFNDVSGPNAVVGSPLTLFSTTGTAGGIGFTSGYDQGNSQVNVIRTNDLTVPLINYASGQTNSVNHWSVAATVSSVGLARRSKIREVTPLTGTIWFSFLASLQNTNGDIALIFNGAFTSAGRFNNSTPGMRVGLGHPSLPGAFGVGTVASESHLASITNGVNGAITANDFVPTDGTAGLVLGRISTDVGTGFPKVDLWYNPDVPNEAALPAPTLSFIDTNFAFVPTTITRIAYQVVRSTTSTQNEVIDNVKISDEPNGFDIVYKNAPLPLPVLEAAIAGPGSESGTNLQFVITSDRVVSSPLTVSYKMSGIATNGFDGSGFVDADFTDPNFDIGTQISSATIPAGQSNVTVMVTVIDDASPEGDESVILTLEPGAEYIGSGSASTVVLENNDANVSAQYMFTRTTTAQVWDTNLTASVFSAAGVSGGFSSTEGYFISPDAAIRARGDSTAANAVDAVANGDFMSFSVSPNLGYGLAVTNLQFQALYGNYLFQEPGAAEAVIFVRSSVDNFATDLGTFSLQPDNVVFLDPWYDFDLPLGDAFTNLIGGVEFRLYIYDDSTQNQVGVRVDDLFIRASTFPAVGVQQVGVTATITNAAEPSISGEFTITRAGDTANPLTVFYSISGTASNGVDYVSLPNSATISAGQSNVVITVSPIDDQLIELMETIELTLLADASYGIVATFSATVNLADDADIGGLIGYLFNESNNGAPTLSAVAAANTMQPDKVEALNASSGPGNGNFGANLAAGVGHGYATSASHSAPATIFIRGEYIAKTATDAITQGNYVSFVVGPKPGNALTLTNLTAYFKMNGGAEETTWAFLRSSQDEFAADIGAHAEIPGATAAAPFQFWSVPLAVADQTAPVEFRIYFYNNTGTIVRLDDVSFQGFVVGGTVGPAIAGITIEGGTVTIGFTGAASDTSENFKLDSSGTVNGIYTEDNTAIISGTGGVFEATTAVSGSTRFYKIRR